MRDKILVSPVLVVLVVAGARLLPHEPNVAPIGAMALFGGAYFRGWRAFFYPLAAMLVSDLFLGFHGMMAWVYGSFALIVLLGRIFLRGKVGVYRIILMSLCSSVLFYLVTNFGVWATGTMYPKTLSGLVECYYLALPFFRNTIVGDLVYTAVFFGAYALAKSFVVDRKWGEKVTSPPAQVPEYSQVQKIRI